jgi:superfamily I DNA/RNA helicase
MTTLRLAAWSIIVIWTVRGDDGVAAVESFDPPRRESPPIRGTPQQVAFWDEVRKGTGNVLLEARAGTGKSTSCREGMRLALGDNPGLAIRYCCFNKAVATDFERGCPPGVEVGTMHRFGLMALSRAFSTQVDQHRTYTLLDGFDGGESLPRYVRKSISVLTSLAKNHGLHPADPDLTMRLMELIDVFDVETWRRQAEVLGWTLKVLARSAESVATADFDDMIWLPTFHDVQFPAVDLLFIDEVQDLNPVQHNLIARLNPSGRTVVTGDPFQSVYAFRGADSESIPKLRERLNPTVLPLTVTFRCPLLHVVEARKLVDDFRAAPDAPDGYLRHDAPEDSVDEAEPGDLVLCRSNAPIVSACLRLIRQRRRAVVRGRALGEQLNAIARKVDAATIAQMIAGIHRWEAREIERLERKDGTDHLMETVHDKALSLEAIADSCSSPSEIPGVIADLFADDDAANRVTFSTVHRAKGSEARSVYYIQIPYSEKRDARRPPQQWELDQRRNLRYVALTRSMDSLTLIDPRRKGD